MLLYTAALSLGEAHELDPNQEVYFENYRSAEST